MDDTKDSKDPNKSSGDWRLLGGKGEETTTTTVGSKSADAASVSTNNPSSASLAATGPLSRLSVYTSMAAYNNDRGIDSSEFMRQQASLPKSIRDASLVEFWKNVSHEYNRSRNNRYPKNTGSRALSIPEIEGRLRLRTLTLVGGGFNTSKPTSSSSSNMEDHRRRPSSSRKKNRVVGCASTTGKQPKCQSSAPSLSPELYQSQIRFLKQLNQMWNEYARGMLGTNLDEFRERLSVAARKNEALVATIEWVGARVKVLDCPQQSRIGLVGILAGETTNTWRVVEEESKTETADDPKSRPLVLRTLVLAKNKSALQVLLPTSAEPSNSKRICIELKGAT